MGEPSISIGNRSLCYVENIRLVLACSLCTAYVTVNEERLRLSFRQRRAAVLAIARTRRVVRAAARVAAELPVVLVAESGTRELSGDDAGRHCEDPPAQ